MSEAEDKTASLLAALWLRNRPVVEERLAMLDAACAAALAGSLSAESRKEAASSAHKLAGSLGMYGYDDGTRIARQIEVLLDAGPPDVAKLSALIADLRGSIFPGS
jgi:HPt (histidine-containing phosphotransfer) domain-containing protein